MNDKVHYETRSDKEEFIGIANQIDNILHESILRVLHEIIGKNQNRPPLGEADGSFTPEQWTAARDAYQSLVKFKTNLEKIK